MPQTRFGLPALFPLKIPSRSAPAFSILPGAVTSCHGKKKALMSPLQIKLPDAKIHTCGWGRGSRRAEGPGALTSEKELDGWGESNRQ